MRLSRLTLLEAVASLALVAVCLGPLFWSKAPLPGSPEQGRVVALRLLADIVARHDISPHRETFLYGVTPEEPAEYSYAVFSRDLKQGVYEIDVQIRWKGVPDTKLVKGERPMEIHLGQLLRPIPF